MSRKIDKAWIQERLKKLGKSQRKLAFVLGVDPARITEILTGKRDVGFDEAIEIADFLEVDLPELALRLLNVGIREPREDLTITGFLGGGDMILPSESQRSAPEQTRAEQTSGRSRYSSVVVCGEGYRPRLHGGDQLIFAPNEAMPLFRCRGRECIVHTGDGRTLLKILEAGSRMDTATLISLGNDEPIEPNVPIIWAAPILWIKLARP